MLTPGEGRHGTGFVPIEKQKQETEMNGPQDQQLVKFMMASAFILVLVILVIVFSHEREKPHSPEEFVATAFNQMFPAREWKPGMGPQPFVYHPAGLNRLVWQPLPVQYSQPQSGG